MFVTFFVTLFVTHVTATYDGYEIASLRAAKRNMSEYDTDLESVAGQTRYPTRCTAPIEFEIS